MTAPAPRPGDLYKRRDTGALRLIGKLTFSDDLGPGVTWTDPDDPAPFQGWCLVRTLNEWCEYVSPANATEEATR